MFKNRKVMKEVILAVLLLCTAYLRLLYPAHFHYHFRAPCVYCGKWGHIKWRIRHPADCPHSVPPPI